MAVGDSGKNDQREHNDDTRMREHSQTLPLITEEIVSSHPTPAAEPTELLVTPVMPPNPIRRDGEFAQQPMTTLPDTPQGSPTAAAPATSATATGVAESTATVDDEKDEKSSDGRISATQLLAGAGAAATSSVIGGQLGVAGTVVGAGVASIVTALAVTLYGRSLDKGKEKIQEVGSKLAPAVKAKIAKNPNGKTAAVDPSLAEDSAFAPPEPAAGNANATAASATGQGASENVDGGADDAKSGSRTWWQKLRCKRVLYPLTIGVAAFGIGLGAVVVAENFTEADISPGTSQISRSVTGSSANDETVINDGTSDSGTGGDDSSRGSGSGTDGGQGSTNSGSSTQNDQSTSAGETGTEGTAEGQSSQGSDTTTGTSDSTGGSTTTDGTDASSGSTSSDGSGSTGDTSGGTSGSTGSGTDGSGTGSGGGSADSGGSGTGGSTGSSSEGSAASAQG